MQLWNWGKGTAGNHSMGREVAHVPIWYPIFNIYDHHNLQNFGIKALLSERQARWASLLAQYEFQIQFYPGKPNGKADALTCRSGDLPKEGDKGGRLFQQILDRLTFSNFPNTVLCNTTIKHNSSIRTALVKDELAIEIVKALDNGEKQLTGKHSRSAPLGEYIVDNGLLYIYGLLFVPNDETCTDKSCTTITTTQQLDTLVELPPVNLSANSTGGQECQKQLPDTKTIVIPVQESNLDVMHPMDLSSLCKFLSGVGVQYLWI